MTRIDVLRRGMLGDLGRLLEAMPARKLGIVVTGVRHRALGYGYGGYYREDARRLPRAAARRPAGVAAEAE